MKSVRLQDVADLAGVSLKTVSNVVRNHPNVSSAMRERVQRAIDDLGYRPNMMGRRLATGRTGLISLAFADVGLPYFAELARVFSRTSPRFGYRMLLEETDDTIEGERALFTGAESGLVDGLIFQPASMSMAELARHGSDLPMVLLGESAAPLSVDRVMIDNVGAAAEVTRHLLASGRKRIGFVGHEERGLSLTSRQRIIGYQEALEEAGIAPDVSLLVPSASISAADALEAVGAALDAGRRFDALVCRDDLAAMGALRALQERGIRVPDDVAVTGWDNIRLSAATFPSITTVSPDLDALADRALALVAERIEGFDGMGRQEIVSHRLVVRESAP